MTKQAANVHSPYFWGQIVHSAMLINEAIITIFSCSVFFEQKRFLLRTDVNLDNSMLPLLLCAKTLVTGHTCTEDSCCSTSAVYIILKIITMDATVS